MRLADSTATDPAWNSLPGLMLGRARQWPGKPMLRFWRDGRWQSMTWADYALAVAAVAAGLRARGVAPGDRVLLVSENRPEFMVADTAIMAIGAVSVPTYTTNTVADHAHVLRDSGARDPGIDGFRASLPKLSRTARDLLTVENDENLFGLDTVLDLADAVPVVFDLHHHWVQSGGVYLEPDDPRIARVVDSWRGVRPVAHVSLSREALLEGHDVDRLPDFPALLAAGHKWRDIAAHSHLIGNRALSALVARHLAWADFEIEAKGKNLASVAIAREIARAGLRESVAGGETEVKAA